MVTINTFPVRRPALRLLVAATGLGVLATGAVGCSARPAQDSPGGRSSSAARAAAPTPRSMGLRDAPNARDLGGYRTADGHQVRHGVVYRADALNHLTPAEQQTLTRDGITQDLDFRSPAEVATARDALPAGVRRTALPVYDPGADLSRTMGTLLAGGPAAQQQALGAGKAVRMMDAYYAWLVKDPAAGKAFGAAARAVADGRTPVLYHCTQGKDRTGWMSAVLLTAAGVPRATVDQDYLASNHYLQASNDRQLAQLRAAGKVKDPALLEPVLGVRESYLNAAFNEVTTAYGSFDGYLRKGLGLDRATEQKLRQRLTSA
ncbi:tyrosine-protein phosphatase [Streptomyces sp. NPDC058000]|uniref:tyrosine-protein phosphatase n=1 Tax=Streptomyces sp. NPDC058000 TaxID=3346299 RepID=UPI0036E3B967